MKPLAVLLLLAACESGKPAPPPEPRASLRVPLPDGWKATAVADGLQAGPAGRVVLLLESTQRPFPQPDGFFAAVAGEGVQVTHKESDDSFVGIRYSIGAATLRRDAFLGVRQTGPRTIWCSTTGSARGDEVEAALQVCKTLSWEG